MKILFPINSFHHLTGSEMYVYELGRELVRLGHRVTVAAGRVEGDMAAPAKAAGILTHRFANVPLEKFDIIHASETRPTQWALSRWLRTPVLCTVHSQYPCERPVLDARVRHYVCVRPQVQDKIVSEDRVPVAKTSVIYNPVDFSRFRPVHGNGERTDGWSRLLFCGTIDQLRRQTILDLIRRTASERRLLTLVGRKADNYDGYIERLPDTVKWHDQTWNVERFIHECDETAGIFLGRTTIEGWACGKPGWIYDLDLAGRIRSRTLHPPPADMGRFDSRLVVKQLIGLYTECLVL